MGKSSAKAPDYTGAAQATAAGNLANLNAQTWANRPTMTTPWGSSSWTTSVDDTAFNRAMEDWKAAGSDPKTMPTRNTYTTWANNVTLTPAQQAALNDQQQIQANQSDLAQTLQGQVADTMRDGFDAPQLSDYTSGVPGVQTNFAGFDPTGVRAVNQQTYNPNSFTRGNQDVMQTFSGGPNQDLTFSSGARALDQSFDSSAPNVSIDPHSWTRSAGSVDLTAPQFSASTAAAGQRAAYDASTGLLKDQWEQDTSSLDNKLRMQGLTPGTEAYNNAMQNLTRTQAQQQNQLANQAVLTGNDMANQNYASALAGYNAGNQAQNQAFTQGLNSLSARNSAIGQQFGQDATSFQLSNDARNQQYANALNAYNAQNNARSTQFGQNATSFGLTNDARTQNLQNDMTLFGATLQGQNAGNTAQGQAWQQALAGYGADTAAQQASNEAQQQAWQQALSNYQTAYGSAYTNYMQPLNSMNAVLTGQQVQNPSFNGFAQAGYTPGADYSGAASALGQWNSAQAAQNNSMFSSLLGTAGQLGAAYMLASDARLKTNIKRVGVTEGGHNWYSWDWADGSGSSRGVMAQEIALTHPEAVVVANDGYYRVNYAAIA